MRAPRRLSIRNGAPVSLLLRAYVTERSIPRSLRSIDAGADIADVWPVATIEQTYEIVALLLSSGTIDSAIVSRAVIEASRAASIGSASTPERRAVSDAFGSAVDWSEGRGSERNVLAELRRAGDVDVRRDAVAMAMWCAAKSVVRFDSVDPVVLSEARHMEDDEREEYLAKMAGLHAQESLNELLYVCAGRSKAAMVSQRLLGDIVRRHVTADVVSRAAHALPGRSRR